MNASEIYEISTKINNVSNDITKIESFLNSDLCRFNCDNMSSAEIREIFQSSIKIKTIVNEMIDYECNLLLATIWFNDKPIMIVYQYGDDDEVWITDFKGYTEMIVLICTNVKNVGAFNPQQEIRVMKPLNDELIRRYESLV